METTTLDKTIGFIGAGQMARALAGGFLDSQLVEPERILAYDPSEEAVSLFRDQIEGSRIVAANAEVIETADVVFLAVKPQIVPSVTSECKGWLSESKLLVSIAAGLSLARLSQDFETDRIVRVMPNTPCMVGCGASGYSLGTGASAEDGQLVEELLEAVGIAFQVKEASLDAVTGLSGSGPAYVYMVIEALADGGVRTGLPRDVALALAAQTVFGAAAMVSATGEHPGVLKDRVTSPGGTTIAGLQVLENHAVRAAMINAVEAATDRSQELGRG